MVFNINTGTIVFFVVILLWNAILSYVLFRMTRHYNRLTGSTTKQTLKDILDELILKERNLEEHGKTLEHKLGKIEKNAQFYIQRIGLVRFNPFSDTGGAQSFTLALLDSQENGLVMTSLYARTGNRWYVKHIKNGKGVGIELSKEEQTAIQKAKHLTEG